MTFGQSLFVILIVALLTALFAKERGRDPYIWFGLGLLGNIFALLLLFILPDLLETSAKKGPKTIDIVATPLYPEFEKYDWFYLDSERKTTGPLPFDKLKGLFQKNSLTESSLVWNEGQTEWLQINKVPRLLDALKS